MKEDLKTRLHQIIDTIEDDQLLETIEQILQNQEEGQVWRKLTEEQKGEVLKASDENKDPDTQTSHDTMIQRNQKWLNR